MILWGLRGIDPVQVDRCTPQPAVPAGAVSYAEQVRELAKCGPDAVRSHESHRSAAIAAA